MSWLCRSIMFRALSMNLPPNKIKSSVKSFRYSRPNRPAHPVGQRGLRAILTFRGDRLRSARWLLGGRKKGKEIGEGGESQRGHHASDASTRPSIHPSIHRTENKSSRLVDSPPLHASCRSEQACECRCIALCEHCLLLRNSGLQNWLSQCRKTVI